MKKIISLFKRDYKGNRQVYDEVVPGAEWVIEGEGVPTIKYDGTACMLRDGLLFKRYDRKLGKAASRKKKRGDKGPWALADFKPAPAGWEPCDPDPDQHTGHWPGWVPIGDGPEDKWHREAMSVVHPGPSIYWTNGTYELVGPAIQGNPYNRDKHSLWHHGSLEALDQDGVGPGRSFSEIRDWLTHNIIEGIVWHHPDGRMVKIKSRDFGLPWPVK